MKETTPRMAVIMLFDQIVVTVTVVAYCCTKVFCIFHFEYPLLHLFLYSFLFLWKLIICQGQGSTLLEGGEISGTVVDVAMMTGLTGDYLKGPFKIRHDG